MKSFETSLLHFSKKEVLLVAWAYFRRNYFSTFAASLKAAWADMKAGKIEFLIELKKVVKSKRKIICEIIINQGIDAFINAKCGFKKSLCPTGDWFEKYDDLFRYLSRKGL